MSQNVEEYTFYPPPPKNRDKSKNLRSVKTALRASTLSALGLLLALAVLLPNAAAEAQTSPASTATATATATPTDYDADNDGLIDIRTLAQLNAVRHDLNGDGKQGSVSTTNWATYTTAFSNPASGMGCQPTDHDDDTTTPQQPTCDGYELMADLDFDTDGDGDVDASDTNSYANWAPIGTAANPFNAKFKGSLTNGVMPKISNLTIGGSSSTTEVGLFGATGSNARIENVGLVDVNVNTTTSARNAKISALVGNNAGKIIACYSTGAITATAGTYPDAGGLVGYNGGTIAAAFSRATVYMSSSSEIYVGGLVGYNGGTITATYSAGAVKGKGGSGVVGGLVGYNVGTINASYSLAPVTSVDVDPTNIRTSKPTVLGLSYNENGFSTVTVSYWDSIISGVPDDADDGEMPEGKSTANLITPIGIYDDWDDLTIDGANDVAPWDSVNKLPLLTYGGHTTDVSGNQLFAYISSRNTGATSPVLEGARYFASIPPSMGTASGPWLWQSSADGITWGSTLVSNIACGVQQDRTCGPAYRATGIAEAFIPRSEHEGKYIRAKAPLEAGGYAYTMLKGKVKLARPATNPTGLNIQGPNPPRVGTQLGVAARGLSEYAPFLWQRCDTNGANPSGCEYVGSNRTYTPGAGDLNHYLRVHVYYGDPWTRSTSGFTQQVADVQRPTQWFTSW